MDTAERIFKLLDEKKIGQKHFAQAIGVTDKVVSKWRTSGLRSYQKYLPQIAAELDVTIDFLLSGEDGQTLGDDVGLEHGVSIDLEALDQKMRQLSRLCNELAELAQEISMMVQR